MLERRNGGERERAVIQSQLKAFILKVVELKSLCVLNVGYEVTVLEFIDWIIFDKSLQMLAYVSCFVEWT